VLRPEEYERALLYKDDPIEQCLPLVAPAVWEACEKLKEHLVPVFEKIIQLHRVKTKLGGGDGAAGDDGLSI